MAHSASALIREPSLDHYKKGKRIGIGGQGQVYRYGVRSSPEVFAVKVLEWKPDRSNRLNIVSEAFISLHAENVYCSIH